MTSDEAPGAAETNPPKRKRFRVGSPAALKRLCVLLLVIIGVLGYGYAACIRMPGSSHRGPLAELTADETAIAAELRRYVQVMVDGDGTRPAVGNRSLFNPRQLAFVAAYLKDELHAAGFAEVREIPVPRGAPSPNFEVVIPGTSNAKEIVVVGAHYDAYQGTPGADDNASGVAACIVLARRLREKPMPRTVRIVLFVNEEPPTFQRPEMGSWVYAKACKAAGDDIVAMLSLECLGYYSDAKGSQQYPPPLNQFYPDTGDFIAVVGKYGDRSLVKNIVADFRSHTKFPSEGVALFESVSGVGWSDHWAFWQESYPAVMITDTALFRNTNYHQPTDTPDTLDFERMARVVTGVERVIVHLASRR